MSNSDQAVTQAQFAAPLDGGGEAAPNVEQARHAATHETEQAAQAADTVLVNQRSADKVLLVETLADFSSDERLVTADELLAAFTERAAVTPPVTVAQVREELQTLPDPRFEGPDSETVAADMARIKAMEKAQPGSAPDPEVPGLRKTRRLLSRRQLLTSLLHPAEALAAPENAAEQTVEPAAVEPAQAAAAPVWWMANTRRPCWPNC